MLQAGSGERIGGTAVETGVRMAGGVSNVEFGLVDCDGVHRLDGGGWGRKACWRRVRGSVSRFETETAGGRPLLSAGAAAPPFFRGRVGLFRGRVSLMFPFGWNRGSWLRRTRCDYAEVVVAGGLDWSGLGRRSSLRRDCNIE